MKVYFKKVNYKKDTAFYDDEGYYNQVEGQNQINYGLNMYLIHQGIIENNYNDRVKVGDYTIEKIKYNRYVINIDDKLLKNRGDK